MDANTVRTSVRKYKTIIKVFGDFREQFSEFASVDNSLEINGITEQSENDFTFMLLGYEVKVKLEPSLKAQGIIGKIIFVRKKGKTEVVLQEWYINSTGVLAIEFKDELTPRWDYIVKDICYESEYIFNPIVGQFFNSFNLALEEPEVVN